MPPPFPDDLIPPRKAAELVAVSVSTIYRWIDDGTLRAYRVGGTRYRLSARDVRALVEEVNPPPPVTTTSEDEEAAAQAIARMRARGHRV